jgi:hypothetical protein
MFNQNGLSLDQAPPISVIFKFFFLGALFGIVSGISLFFYQVNIFDTSTAAAITFTHLFTLGIMLSFMFAALFQMLPVIAGVTLTSPIKRSNLLLYPFTVGVILLLVAFNFHYPSLYFLAALFLVSSIITAIIPMLIALWKVQTHSDASKGISFSLISLLCVVLLALYLLTTLSGTIEGTYYQQIKTAHYSFGLFGWISLLIISVSFQVIEMFYVTPPYPKVITNYWVISLFILLVLSSIIGLFTPKVWIISNILLAIMLSLYALVTLRRLTQKKRPLSDATVWFWRLGLSLLLLSMLCMVCGEFTLLKNIKPLSYIFFATFSLSIVFAMFYKIIPFLTWFHLNSQGYFTAPMMHEIIHPRTAKKHLYIHIATLITFILSLFVNTFIFLAALLTILSFSWMAYQIIHAQKLYKQTQENGEKFNMGNMK